MVNARGQLVGTAFDNNIHGIAGDFTYDAALNRTIAVSTVAITEALQKVYGDTALARELSSSEPSPGGRRRGPTATRSGG